jgi:diguanylate cyclase (GGDEF)-like protein
MNSRARKPVRPAPKTDWTKGFAKGALQLVDSMEERGLLAREEVERLQQSVEEAVGEKSSTGALGKIGAFHRRLGACLTGVGVLAESAKGKKLDALFEINRLIAHTHESAECFERLVTHIRKLIPCEGATLYLVDRKSGRLNVAASMGPQIDLIERIEFERGIGFSGWVAKTKRPVLFGSLKRSQPQLAGVIKSFISVPLVVAGDTIGVINLGHSQEGVFSKDDLRLLILVASQAGGLIQKTLLLEEIRELAITDDLTGLYNRRHLMLRMQDEVARASRFIQEFSVIFLDVDNFKVYNDAYGHETGDRALADLGGVLKSMARATDILARYGGEEFVLLLPATGREEALVVAERLRLAVEGHLFPRRKRLTVSVGAATYPEDSTDPQELLGLADKALYQAKREGRNRIVALPAAAA